MTEEREREINYVAKLIKKEFPNEQFASFIQLLKDHGFFNHISTGDLEWFASEKDVEFAMSTLKSNGVEIGMYFGDGSVLVGIDPSSCFCKTNRCSVLTKFPMSKREYRRFENFFNRINDRKSELGRDWKREASACFYGAYAKFGF